MTKPLHRYFLSVITASHHYPVITSSVKYKICQISWKKKYKYWNELSGRSRYTYITYTAKRLQNVHNSQFTHKLTSLARTHNKHWFLH